MTVVRLERRVACSTRDCIYTVRIRVGQDARNPPICTNCRSSWHYYLTKKTAADVIKRKQKLAMFVSRLDNLPARREMVQRRRARRA